MSLWEKIKADLEDGLETISEKSIELSKLVKLKWERRTIQKHIHQELISLGKSIYEVHRMGDDNPLPPSIEENVKQINDLEKQLQEKDAEIEDMTDKIDQKQVKSLKKDLEMGDGTIEQIIVKKDSPLSGKKLMDIQFPKNVLIGTVVREHQVIIPDGQTVLHIDDKVTLLGKKEDVEDVLKHFNK